MATDEPHRAAVNAYFSGINQERYDDVAGLFADDGELTAPGTAPRRGGVAVAAYFAAALAPYPVHLDDPGRMHFAGDTVIVEIHFTGTTATGSTLEFDAVDVFDFDQQGKITKLSSWYDSYTVRQWLRQARQAAGAAS